jgi:hypothetical protein
MFSYNKEREGRRAGDGQMEGRKGRAEEKVRGGLSFELN